MKSRSLLSAALGCALLFGGCGGDQNGATPPPSTVPDKPPTARQLAQIRSTATAPFYWLGPGYGGRPLTRATFTPAEPPDSIFQYGRPTCVADVGCSYELGVATLRRRDPDVAQRCWRRLGPALVLGCDQATTLQVYTGPVEVFVSSHAIKPVRVARTLRLKGLGTAAGRPLDGLAPPRPFSCKEAARFAPDARAQVPAELAPGACPG